MLPNTTPNKSQSHSKPFNVTYCIDPIILVIRSFYSDLRLRAQRFLVQISSQGSTSKFSPLFTLILTVFMMPFSVHWLLGMLPSWLLADSVSPFSDLRSAAEPSLLHQIRLRWLPVDMWFISPFPGGGEE